LAYSGKPELKKPWTTKIKEMKTEDFSGGSQKKKKVRGDKSLSQKIVDEQLLQNSENQRASRSVRGLGMRQVDSGAPEKRTKKKKRLVRTPISSGDASTQKLKKTECTESKGRTKTMTGPGGCGRGSVVVRNFTKKVVN